MADALCLSSFGSQVAAALTSADRLITISAGNSDAAFPAGVTTEEFDIGTFSSAIFIPNIHYYGISNNTAQNGTLIVEYILSCIPNQAFQVFPNPLSSSNSYKSYVSASCYFGWYTTETQFVVKYATYSTSASYFLKRVDGVIAVLS